MAGEADLGRPLVHRDGIDDVRADARLGRQFERQEGAEVRGVLAALVALEQAEHGGVDAVGAGRERRQQPAAADDGGERPGRDPLRLQPRADGGGAHGALVEDRPPAEGVELRLVVGDARRGELPARPRTGRPSSRPTRG